MLKTAKKNNSCCCYEDSGEVSERTAYENLANAIVVQAVDDYRQSYTKICKKKKSVFQKEGKTLTDFETGVDDYRHEVLKFISSKFFGSLTSLRPEFLINSILDEEAEWVENNGMAAFAN